MKTQPSQSCIGTQKKRIILTQKSQYIDENNKIINVIFSAKFCSNNAKITQDCITFGEKEH